MKKKIQNGVENSMKSKVVYETTKMRVLVEMTRIERVTAAGPEVATYPHPELETRNSGSKIEGK